MKTVRDPHHGGVVEWKLENNRYFQRYGFQTKWTEVKRTHPTPARIAALHSLSTTEEVQNGIE